MTLIASKWKSIPCREVVRFVLQLDRSLNATWQSVRCHGTLCERSRNLIWYPFTQAKTAEDPIPICRASGSYVYDESDKAYLDLISSWWVKNHGHCHPEIVEVIYEQAKTLDHIIFAGHTHEPAVALCESLTQVLPSKLKRFFFSDDGSTAVEVALKMASQYWSNRGDINRKNFLCFEGGYHGDTFGAMSVGRSSGYFDAWKDHLFNTLVVPFPETWDGDNSVETKEAKSLAVLEKYLIESDGSIAAIILEPLIQGASGMRICRHQFLEQVVKLVRKYSCLVIFDEVMTGFGRTGTLFALDQVQEACRPDFVCLSKGITGGFLPLALTVTTEEVYEAFLGDEFKSAFVHGHSYTANPITCAAAIKSLEILRRAETTEAMQRIMEAQVKGLKELHQELGNVVVKPRTLGTIAAFEISGKFDFNLNQYLKKQFAKEGLILRPLGNTVYVMPPFSTTPNEIQNSYNIISKVIKSIR